MEFLLSLRSLQIVNEGLLIYEGTQAMALAGVLAVTLCGLLVARGGQMKQARTPLLPNRPFVVLWNAPTESCRLRFKVEHVSII